MKNSNLYTEFLIAFGQALHDPENLRVIVETNEKRLGWYSPKTGEPVYENLYYMIDKIDDRWFVSSSFDPCCSASPKNIVRWAETMIKNNRVSTVYAEGY